MVPHNEDFDFKLTMDAKITGGEDLFLPRSRVGHLFRALRVVAYEIVDCS